MDSLIIAPLKFSDDEVGFVCIDCEAICHAQTRIPHGLVNYKRIALPSKDEKSNRNYYSFRPKENPLFSSPCK